MASLEQQQAQQRPTFDSIGAIKAQLMKDVQAKLAEQGQQDSFYDHVMGFLHAINWKVKEQLGHSYCTPWQRLVCQQQLLRWVHAGQGTP